MSRKWLRTAPWKILSVFSAEPVQMFAGKNAFS